jgi:hypothetical protein
VGEGQRFTFERHGRDAGLAKSSYGASCLPPKVTIAERRAPDLDLEDLSGIVGDERPRSGRAQRLRDQPGDAM